MAASFSCPHCGQVYALTPEQVPQYSRQTITCSVCRQAFTVPDLVGASPEVQPAYAPQYQAGYTPQYQAAAQYAPVSQPASGLAIASLVMGVLAFCVPVVLSIPAIICGVMGMRRASEGRAGGKGMAIAGLILGCVSIVLGAIPLMVMLPALTTAKGRAQRLACAANLRQIGTGMMLYTTDNRGFYPGDCKVLIAQYGLTPQTFVCPGSNDTAANGADDLHSGNHLSYKFAPVRRTNVSPRTVLAYEPLSNHGDGANFLFNDGSVEWIARAQAQQAIAEIESGQNPSPALGRTVPRLRSGP